MTIRKFNYYMNVDSNYITFNHVQEMTTAQRITFRKKRNPFVIFLDYNNEEYYIKLDKYINERGNLL